MLLVTEWLEVIAVRAMSRQVVGRVVCEQTLSHRGRRENVGRCRDACHHASSDPTGHSSELGLLSQKERALMPAARYRAQVLFASM